MRVIDFRKVYVQYRNPVRPYNPVTGRKYTITHSDATADLYVFIAKDYAQDQITSMRDEVRLTWESGRGSRILYGYVLVDGSGINSSSSMRSRIFYNEMPLALQALRHADRFLFDKYPELDSSPVFIRFASSNIQYNKTYNFGVIGDYKV